MRSVTRRGFGVFPDTMSGQHRQKHYDRIVMVTINPPKSWFHHWRLVPSSKFSQQSRCASTQSCESQPMRKRRPRNKELARLHALMDHLEIPDGNAVERMVHWARHRRNMFRANGHSDGCQCMTCLECNTIEQFWNSLIAPPDIEDPSEAGAAASPAVAEDFSDKGLEELPS